MTAPEGRPVRVLVIAPSLDRPGGQSIQAARLLDGLRREPSVHASFLRTDTALPGPLRGLRSLRYARTLVRFPLYVAALAAGIPRCDVLHVFSASYWSFLLTSAPAVTLARLFGKRVVLNYHSGEAPEHLVRSRTAVRLLGRVDAIVVPSAFLEETFARFGLATTVVPNHVDLDAWPFRARGAPQPVFLSARALEPSYGVATVLHAFGLVQKRFPQAELRIVGDGSSRRELEGLARELGLRAVTFSGTVEPARMSKVYDAADVLLNGSTVDNFPLSLLEAFASGLPIVSTAAGGIPWLVGNEKTGLLVPLDDPKAMAAAAVRLLLDRDLATRLADAARAECSKYSWSAVRPQWLALYDRLAAPRTWRASGT
jgi:glycosyltransferase involved in cell wall biosynthesis